MGPLVLVCLTLVASAADAEPRSVVAGSVDRAVRLAAGARGTVGAEVLFPSRAWLRERGRTCTPGLEVPLDVSTEALLRHIADDANARPEAVEYEVRASSRHWQLLPRVVDGAPFASPLDRPLDPGSRPRLSSEEVRALLEEAVRVADPAASVAFDGGCGSWEASDAPLTMRGYLASACAGSWIAWTIPDWDGALQVTIRTYPAPIDGI